MQQPRVSAESTQQQNWVEFRVEISIAKRNSRAGNLIDSNSNAKFFFGRRKWEK